MDNIIQFDSQQRSIFSEIEKIRSLRESGLSLGQIATKLGIPKSTIALRLKVASRLNNIEDPKPTSEPQTETTSHRIVPAQSPCNDAQSSSMNVQQIDCTNNLSPTVITSNSADAHQTSSFHEHLATSKSSTTKPCTPSWTIVARSALLFLPTVTLTPWLIATTASVYCRDVGKYWGWLLAIGIEGFVIALAVLAPSAAVKFESPKEFISSLVDFLKVIFWYLILIGICYYNYQTTTLTVTENHVLELSSISASAEKNTSLNELKETRKNLLITISKFEDHGWLGEVRKMREDLKTVESKIESFRNSYSSQIPITKSAIDQRKSIGNYLRAIALGINVICLHLLVRLFSKTKKPNLTDNI